MFRYISFLILFTLSLHAHEPFVLAVGEPIIDLIYHIDEETLEDLKMEKGGSLRVEYPEFQRLQQALQHKKHTIVPGGSSANTIKGIARLGQKCCYIGKIGSDPMGSFFSKKLINNNVTPKLLSASTPTTRLLSLVTPEGQRTMRCCFGASSELMADDLKVEDFIGAKHIHLEGYILYNTPVMLRTIEIAHSIGATLSIDLASFEVVRHFRSMLKDLLKTNFDIVFANEDEAFELTGYEPLKACEEMQKLCPVAVILLGAKGCLVGSKNGFFRTAAPLVPVVDSTGAGDLFISGFLHGHLEGLPLESCAKLGNLIGSTCVMHEGAEISKNSWDKLRDQIIKTINDDRIN